MMRMLLVDYREFQIDESNEFRRTEMRLNSLKAILKTAVRGASVLLLGAGFASAQQQLNLTAGPRTITLPDGSAVPMWGYSCGTAATGSTATCASLHTGATGCAPVLTPVPP